MGSSMSIGKFRPRNPVIKKKVYCADGSYRCKTDDVWRPGQIPPKYCNYCPKTCVSVSCFHKWYNNEKD